MQDSPISWSACWISSSIIGGPRITAPVPFLRKTFRVEGPIESATLHITALGAYECEINGRLVTENVFVPGWTDYRKRVPFQSYDVTALLSNGTNAIGAILGDGWYTGHIAMEDRGLYGERPQLLVQLEMTMQDGKIERIVSDGSWKTTTGPILESDMLMGETYDAQRELPEWSTAACDETGWLPVALAPDPRIVIDRSPSRPVKRHEILWGREMEYPEYSPRWPKKRYDFGQNLTGRVRLTLRGQRGARIEIRHGEMLEKGKVYTENLRGARARDSYTLKGTGTEVWEPHFTFHGFRYAELGWDGAFEVKIEKIEAVVLHSDMPPTGTFRCSHDLLNRLEQNIIWGQKGNFLEVPTDCPQRDERLGWTGDAQVFIRTAAFHMDVQGFFRKWVRDIRDAQAPNGAVPSYLPNTVPSDKAVDGGPAWADATFICPWTIYRCYGDVGIVRDHYDSMTRYMDYLEKNKVKDYIRSHPDVDSWGGFGDWLALDGSSGLKGATSKEVIGTAHYSNNARIMAEASELLGKAVEAKKYRELHGKIVEAFRQRFVTPGGLISSGTQTAYVLALHFNLVPPPARAATARELVRAIERNGMHLGTGFVGTPYLLHVLEAHGYLDVAYKLLEQETFPSWLFPVKNGATTIWERWDGWTPDKGFQDKSMNSFNHYAYGAVGDWMVSTMAGLEIDEPGYKKILFKPRPGGTITWAEASLETSQGLTSIRWDLSDGTLELKLTVPPGSEATLSLPPGWKADLDILQSGTHKITAKRAA